MMKSIKKVIVFLAIIFVLINICTYSFAEDEMNLTTVQNAMNDTTKGLTTDSGDSLPFKIIKTVYRFIQVAAIGFVVLKFTFLGIKYFMVASTGRPEEITKVKANLANHAVVSCIIIGVEAIFTLIYNAIIA